MCTVVLAAVALAAPAGNGVDRKEPRVRANRSCTAPLDGFDVELPAGWHTNNGSVTQRCRWFHSEPFELRASADAGHVAIHIRRSPISFDEMLRAETEGPGVADVLRQEERVVDGRHAVRIESRAGPSAFYSPGTRLAAYVVDLGDHTIIGSTSEAGTDDFEARVAALDQMMSSLRVGEIAPARSIGRETG